MTQPLIRNPFVKLLHHDKCHFVQDFLVSLGECQAETLLFQREMLEPTKNEESYLARVFLIKGVFCVNVGVWWP